MSSIEFHTEVGAPAKYDLLYVSILDDGTERPRIDAATAATRTEALAIAGSAAAQFVLGHMLLSGEGVARDAAAAFRWFSLAAQSGRADAINMVGRCHQCGWGVDENRAEAARWFRAAADKGNAWAMFNLGELMLAGDGTERNVGGALALFVRAARRGNAKAMNMIGQYREAGWASAVKLAAAVRWYRRAAERGCFRGQYNLARFLAREGRMEDATGCLRVAFANAPPEFRRAAAADLLRHREPRLQAVGREVLAHASVNPSTG